MESIGEYEYSTKDLIGHGAFAVVYKGRRKANPEVAVAVKSITKKNVSKSSAGLLGKEIKILKELSQLQHENVVALLDCKETQRFFYLVMEYCNGGDLADYLHAKGTLSENTIRLFLRQIAGAMKALYVKGIVHRDLKPQNILLCHDRPNPSPADITLKIADFGFARFLQDGVMAATLCGSPMYMAPEVIMSLQYDAKADLWSIGTIVFQCLTGSAPFRAQSPQALKQFYEKSLALSPKIPSGTSPELAGLLQGLLKRNARDRIDFDHFFGHPFLTMATVMPGSSPVPVPRRGSCSTSPLVSPYGTPQLPPSPGMTQWGTPGAPLPATATLKTATASQTKGSLILSPEEQDFVLVENDLCAEQWPQQTPPRSTGTPPHTQPIPVPSKSVRQRKYASEIEAAANGRRPSMQQQQQQSPSRVPRGTPDIEKLTPPSVNFTLGGGHQTGASPPSLFSASPSGLRLSPAGPSGSSPIRTGAVRHTTGLPSLSAAANNPLGARAMTLPELTSDATGANATATKVGVNPQAGQIDPRKTDAVGATVPANANPERGLLQRSGSVNTLFTLSPSALIQFAQNRYNDSAAMLFEGGTKPGASPPLATSPSSADLQFFVAPELPPETILDRAHNETLAKLNFVHALVVCILELAKSRASCELSLLYHHDNNPLAELSQTVVPQQQLSPNGCSHEALNGGADADRHAKPASDLEACEQQLISGRNSSGCSLESYRQAEQLVLHMRAVHLLSSALQLAKRRIEDGSLQPSATVKDLLRQMRHKLMQGVEQCTVLSQGGSLPKRALTDPQVCQSLSADRLLYNHAIEMCQSAALEELFGSPHESFKRYQTAQILLHCLAQQVEKEEDKLLLSKYKTAVERRLTNLQFNGPDNAMAGLASGRNENARVAGFRNDLTKNVATHPAAVETVGGTSQH